MGIRNIDSTTIAIVGLCLYFTLVIDATPVKVLDSDCPGPMRYYKELGCTPIFKNLDDRCPIRYNCDHWNNLPNDKCFINGHVYEIGESLREEDRNPCDIDCVCSRERQPKQNRQPATHPFESGNAPIFACKAVIMRIGQAYNPINLDKGCYWAKEATKCFDWVEVCPSDSSVIAQRPTCIVDGKTYKDGDQFYPLEDPKKRCFCGPGYTGENVEPFCVSPKHDWCDNVIDFVWQIRQKCAPIYRHGDSPQKDCNTGFRCPNDYDYIIGQSSDKSAELKYEKSDMLCQFGNLTMQVGDELQQDTGDVTTTCMRCICEVPPVPTCKRMSDEERRILGDVGAGYNFEKICSWPVNQI